MAEGEQALDFKATTRLLGALTTKPISYAKDVAGNRDALDKAKFRTSAANATWVPKKESQQAETDVRMLTKHAWHIGAGYNIGVGHAEQHAFGTLGSHAGQEPPRLYEYAGLTVTKFTSSSGPLMSDQRKDARVSHMLGSKKERHDYAVKETEERIKLINDSLETVVVEQIRVVRTNLKENEETIEELYMRVADEFLTRIDMAQLQGVWSEYQEQSKLREVWISEFEEETEALEIQRGALVKNELKTLGTVLLDVAHEQRALIERLLEEYAHKHNILTLNNRRAYADMLQRLRCHEIERDKKARVRWEGRKEAWYNTLHDRAVAKCKAVLESKPYSNPKKRDTLYGALRSQQVILFERRINMWMDLQALTPPSLTVEKAKLWQETLAALDSEQELEHKQRCGALRKFEQEHYQDSKKVIEELKGELKGYAEMTDALMPTEEELAECSEPFEALILKRRELGQEAVRQCSETLALQLQYLRTPGAALGVLVLRVAEICEQQTAEVRTQRESHAAAMERLRQDNATKEIKLEDELDFIITLMRQDSSVDSLRDKLPQALEALERIKEEYRRFYDESMQETRSFNTGMRQLLSNIDLTILLRLGLGTQAPRPPTPKEEEAEEAAAEEEEGEEKEDDEPKTVVYDDEEQTVGEDFEFVTLKNERRLFVTDAALPQHAHDLVGILNLPHKTEDEMEEVRRLAELAEEEAAALAAHAEPPAAEEEEEAEEEGKVKFIANAQVSPQNPFSAWGNEPLLEVLEIPLSSLVAIRRTQRRALLEYKSEQDVDVLQDTDAVVKEEQETLTVQLDERLRQWAPRPGRAEMDVYELRDTQLHQHGSKKDRHVGALSMRAAVQQTHFTSLLAEAERALKEHCKAQGVRVKALENATNTSQLSNYDRLAKLNDLEFKDAARARQLVIEEFAHESLHGLQKMNRQFVENCYLFEELGGPAGKGGTYNPDEISEYKAHLEELDNDAAERAQEWIAYGQQMLERHVQRAKEELDKFFEAMRNVDTDITLLEAVDKQVRTCSLMQQQVLSSHDALVATLDGKIVELERLCAGASSSVAGDSSASVKEASVGDAAEEEAFQENPISINLLQTLYSIRWRVLERVKFMKCLESQIELQPFDTLLPPPPPPQEDCPEALLEEQDLQALRNALWPPAPPPDEEGAAAAEAALAAPTPAEPARFTKIGKTDEPGKRRGGGGGEAGEPSFMTADTFEEAVGDIQAKQAAALEALVGEYFENLGDRAITRLEGALACTAERFIPPDAEAFAQKNAKRLADLHASAMESQKSKIRYLRSLVARISTALSKVPAAIFLNVSERARRRAKARRNAIQDAFLEDKKAWQGVREEHNVMLKPSLGNSNARAELLALTEAEEARSARALELTDKALQDSLVVEAEESWRMYIEYDWTSNVVFRLYDSIVQPQDLVATDEDVIATRKTLLTLMREQQKKADGTERGAPPEGKAFLPKSFRGLRKGELGSPALLLLAQQMQRDPSFTAKKALAVKSAAQADAIECNDTANHAILVKARDRQYNHYRLNFATQVERCLREFYAVRREELRWRVNWQSLVHSLKES